MAFKKSSLTENNHENLSETDSEQSNILNKLCHANIERTIYLLENYHKYQQVQMQHIDIKTSKLILSIISESMDTNPAFTDNEKSILDSAGGLICLGIHAAIDELKNLPWRVGHQVYPVLWEQYFHHDGPAVSVLQLMERLAKVDNKLATDEALSVLKKGQIMMSAMIFDNKLLSTWKSSLLAY